MNMEDIMNAAPLVEITPEIAKTLEKGALIGFKAYGDKITAAYQLKHIFGNRVEFYLVNKPEKSITDACLLAGTFVNNPPIIISVHESFSTPFPVALGKLFNKYPQPTPNRNSAAVGGEC